MENQAYDSVVGSSDAPYLNSLARACGLATNYQNIAHPSLPNYIAATSGLEGGGPLGPFSSDCNPSPDCSTAAPSMFAQVRSWRAYQESMPGPCERSDSGRYAARHNPPLYYRGLRGCRSRDVPLPQLFRDLRAGALPAFSFITPNLCNDTHDCPVSVGDRWLSHEVPRILASRPYRDKTTALFITYDEGEGGTATDCTTNRTDPGCHIPLVVVSPSTRPGTRPARLFNHYSLLRTTEDLLGLPPLGSAAQATPMTRAFGL